MSRLMKECRSQYYDTITKDLDKKYYDRMIASTHKFLSEISNDIVILYYGINQNLKNNNVELKHEEQQTYAVMAMLMIDLMNVIITQI